MNIRPFQPDDEPAVIALWDTCGLISPQNDPHRDIQRKRRVNPELFLLAVENEQIIGSVMAGYEGHRGWINYLAVSPEHQRKGVATELMRKAEMLLREMGCPKINLQVRESNRKVIEFYKTLGFSIDAAVSLGKRLISDE